MFFLGLTVHFRTLIQLVFQNFNWFCSWNCFRHHFDRCSDRHLYFLSTKKETSSNSKQFGHYTSRGSTETGPSPDFRVTWRHETDPRRSLRRRRRLERVSGEERVRAVGRRRCQVQRPQVGDLRGKEVCTNEQVSKKKKFSFFLAIEKALLRLMRHSHFKFFWGGYLGLWKHIGGPLFSCFSHFSDQVFWGGTWGAPLPHVHLCRHKLTLK